MLYLHHRKQKQLLRALENEQIKIKAGSNLNQNFCMRMFCRKYRLI